MDILIITLVALMILAGFIGIILPGLPGAGLMFLGMFLSAWYFGWETIGVAPLVILGILAVVTIVLDYFTAAYGAKKYGGSKYAAWGAFLGGLAGLVLLNLPGLLIGLFGGAVAGEMFYAKKGLDASLEAGKGAVVGFLVGTGMKLLIGLLMIGFFLWQVLT